MLPSRARVLAGVYETVADNTPAWEADVLLNYEHLFFVQKSTVKGDSHYSFQFNKRARPARLKPVAFCLKGRCSIQLCYEQTREGTVMSRSPQDKWIGAPLGGRFSNLHCALTVSREEWFPCHLQ